MKYYINMLILKYADLAQTQRIYIWYVAALKSQKFIKSCLNLNKQPLKHDFPNVEQAQKNK